MKIIIELIARDKVNQLIKDKTNKIISVLEAQQQVNMEQDNEEEMEINFSC